MQTYDLLLQPMTVGAPWDVPALEALLEARGAKRTPLGGLLLTFGRVEVELRRVLENGAPIALEARLPYGEQSEFVPQVVDLLIELTRAQGLRLIDPTLSRSLVAADAGPVEESYRRAASFAGEYMGVGDALGSTAAPVPTGFAATNKYVLALVVFVFFVWLGWQFAMR